MHLGIVARDEDLVLEVKVRQLFLGQSNNAHLSVHMALRVIIDDRPVDRRIDTLNRCIL